MNQRKRGRPKKDPHQIITAAQIEQARIKIVEKERVDKYKKLQLYYYFSIGREYLDSSVLAAHERVKIRKKLEILDKLDIPHVLGREKILALPNLLC
jgi:hypothetical protein